MPTVAGQTTTWNVFHYTDLRSSPPRQVSAFESNPKGFE